ncbi:MAG TPA: hypothetical protein VGM90_40500 [Kofleriaceae bacterium]|jgi:hypothetical protein
MQPAPGRLWYRPAQSRVRLALIGVLVVAAMASVAGAEVPRNKYAWAPAAEPKANTKAAPKRAVKAKRTVCPKAAGNHVANDAAIVLTPPATKDGRLTASAGMLIVPPAVDAAIVLALPTPSPSTHGPCRGS